tara:strand:- start:242 stop:685 length:444 start_codon:yes stop_codon:yes gene_type:complete
MLFISNRGNLYDKLPDQENVFSYVTEAISQNIDVKIDLWVEDDQYHLGNDKPESQIDFSFLVNYSSNLWVQCRNKEALDKLQNFKMYLNFFWDEGNKDFIVTSKGNVISLNKENTFPSSIYFLGEHDYEKEECVGICSDKIMTYINH